MNVMRDKEDMSAGKRRKGREKSFPRNVAVPRLQKAASEEEWSVGFLNSLSFRLWSAGFSTGEWECHLVWRRKTELEGTLVTCTVAATLALVVQQPVRDIAMRTKMIRRRRELS